MAHVAFRNFANAPSGDTEVFFTQDRNEIRRDSQRYWDETLKRQASKRGSQRGSMRKSFNNGKVRHSQRQSLNFLGWFNDDESNYDYQDDKPFNYFEAERKNYTSGKQGEKSGARDSVANRGSMKFEPYPVLNSQVPQSNRVKGIDRPAEQPPSQTPHLVNGGIPKEYQNQTPRGQTLSREPAHIPNGDKNSTVGKEQNPNYHLRVSSRPQAPSGIPQQKISVPNEDESICDLKGGECTLI